MQFALTPAQANQNILDLSSAAGQKLYKAAIAPLTTLFDGTAATIRMFLSDVAARAESFHWHNILNVPDAMGVPRSLITAHRLLTLQDVRNHAATYANQQVRDAQNSYMMYEFLRGSLGEAAKKRMANEDDKFRVTNAHIPSGTAYLKVLLLRFAVETNATTYHIRQTLQDLPKKMRAVNDNIDEFNQFVNAQVADLAAGGQTTDDLVMNLFRAYLTVRDHQFLGYIRRKKEIYDEMMDPNELTPERLMDLALTKYLQLKQEGVWRAKSKQDERYIALTARLNEQNQTILALQATSSSKKKGPSNKNKDGTDENSEKKKGKKEYKIAAWKKERPAGGKGTLERNGKTFHWCEHHGFYTASHATADCQLTDEQKKKNRQQREKERKEYQKKLKLANPAIENDPEEDENPFHDA